MGLMGVVVSDEWSGGLGGKERNILLVPIRQCNCRCESEGVMKFISSERRRLQRGLVKRWKGGRMSRDSLVYCYDSSCARIVTLQCIVFNHTVNCTSVFRTVFPLGI